MDIPQSAVTALEHGRKIEAIKLVREDCHLGLKQAKEAVEAYEQEHPEIKHASSEQTSGGMTISSLIAVVCVLVILSLLLVESIN